MKDLISGIEGSRVNKRNEVDTSIVNDLREKPNIVVQNANHQINDNMISKIKAIYVYILN